MRDPETCARTASAEPPRPIMRTAVTPDARARVVHGRLLAPTEGLHKFARGLQHACSPGQWSCLRPIVERNCAPAIRAELTSESGLAGDGPIV
jgi:hypothetical protein